MLPTRNLFVPVLSLLVLWAGAHGGSTPSHPAVEMRGVSAAMKFEALLAGFLQPLNARLKLRASEIAFEPGGSLGDHLHVGPGIRLVLAGELTVTPSGAHAEQVVKSGEYFYEAGDQSFRVENRTPQPARLLVVELLPADWQGSAAVALERRAELEQVGEQLRKRLQEEN